MSDPHFGHKNMAIKRGFQTVEDHNEHIIKMWNNKVGKRDVVYLLGDITMEKANYKILERLNGLIHVVGGNHDKRQHTREMLKYVHSYSGCTKHKGYILTHIPIHESEVDIFRGNIHGHLHNYIIEDKRYYPTSWERLGYPHTLEQLLKRNEYRFSRKTDKDISYFTEEDSFLIKFFKKLKLWT